MNPGTTALLALALSGFTIFSLAVSFRSMRGVRFARRCRISLLAALAALAPPLGGLAARAVAIWLGTTHAQGEDTFIALSLEAMASLILLTAYLTTPGRQARLPELADPAFKARVAELAGLLGLEPPPVRLLGSTGSRPALAYIGGIGQPTMIVTEGILSRLTSAERDSVIGHELAHVSTGSLWLLAGTGLAAGTAASLWSAADPWASLALFPALAVGFRRILGRRMEVVCDLASARVVGYATAATALDKVHAIIQLPRGWRQDVFHAVSGHPSLEIRRAELRSAAPAVEAGQIEQDSSALARDRRWTRIALAAWVAVVVATLGADLAGFRATAIVAWLSLAAAPLFFRLLVSASALRWQRKRLGGWRLNRVVWFMVAALVMIGVGARVDSWTAELLSGSAIVLASLFLPNARARREVLLAIRDKRFAEGVKAGERHPRALKRDPLLAHNVALARALAGDRAGAVASFENGASRWPWMPLMHITAAVILLGEDPARALTHARTASTRLPGDPGAELLLARALCKTGQIGQARTLVEKVMAAQPLDGVSRAVAAQLAAKAGDFDRADRLIAAAEKLSPGETLVVLAKAQIAIAAGRDGQTTLEAARSTIKASPFAFLETDLAELELRSAAIITRR